MPRTIIFNGAYTVKKIKKGKKKEKNNFVLILKKCFCLKLSSAI